MPVVLKALGRKSLPGRIRLPGGDYELVRLFKHDFFAATALYTRRDGHRVVLKIGRTADILGLPAAWIGRWLVAREARMYRLLADEPQVPSFAGTWGRCAFAHDYAEGRPLQRGDQVSAAFFDELQALIERLHSRDMAYVDLEKCENIILGVDGRPYLIDFQIAWCPAGHVGRRLWPWVWIRSFLQNMDRYHLHKHRRRFGLEPGGAPEGGNEIPPPWYIRVHRAVTAPLQRIRRGVLRRVDPAFKSRPR